MQPYLTVNPYDLVGLFEATEHESAAVFLLNAYPWRDVRTIVLRAYDREAMSSLRGRPG
jgi:uncharacterized protein with GYD domain